MRNTSLLLILALIVTIAGLFALPRTADADPPTYKHWLWLDPCGGEYWCDFTATQSNNETQHAGCHIGVQCLPEDFYIKLEVCNGRAEVYLTPTDHYEYHPTGHFPCRQMITGGPATGPGESTCDVTDCDDGC